jgi:hypothetical protein
MGFDLFESVAVILRWVAATGPSLALAALAARGVHRALRDSAILPAEWQLRPDVAAGLVLGLAALAWPLPIASISLDRQWASALPIVEPRRLRKVIRPLAELTLLFGATGATLGAAAAGLYFVPGIGLTILAMIAYWVAFWYLAILLARRLGVFLNTQGKTLGWYR